MRSQFGTISVLFVAAFGVPLANAASTGYTIDFSAPSIVGFGILPTAGSFVYDSGTQTFSDFKITWDGHTLDLTASANNPVNYGAPCIGASTGGQATFLLLTSCPQPTNPATNATWYGDCCTSGEAFFLIGHNGYDGEIYISSDTANFDAGPRVAQGDFTVSPTPEPASCGLMLIGLGLLARKRITRRWC